MRKSVVFSKEEVRLILEEGAKASHRGFSASLRYCLRGVLNGGVHVEAEDVREGTASLGQLANRLGLKTGRQLEKGKDESFDEDPKLVNPA